MERLELDELIQEQQLILIHLLCDRINMNLDLIKKAIDDKELQEELAAMKDEGLHEDLYEELEALKRKENMGL